jgi:hypothetical protein
LQPAVRSVNLSQQVNQITECRYGVNLGPRDSNIATGR